MSYKNFTVIRETNSLFERKVIEVKLPIAIHQNNQKSGIIIISYPGFNGDINGYNNKYLALADFMQERIGATVIRSGNHYYLNLDYRESVQDDLRAVIGYALKNSKEICGSENPILYLMGFSAGASAVAAISYEYPAVKKILLMAPSGDAGPEALEKGLSEYTGEVFIAVGTDDEVVGSESAKIFAHHVKKTSAQYVIIPNCDHQFRGTENGMIMSNAPIWAFKGGIKFPTSEGGKVLY